MHRAKGGDTVSDEVVYLSRSAEEKPPRPEIDDEQVRALLRAVGLARKVVDEMLGAKRHQS